MFKSFKPFKSFKTLNAPSGFKNEPANLINDWNILNGLNEF